MKSSIKKNLPFLNKTNIKRGDIILIISLLLLSLASLLFPLLHKQQGATTLVSVNGKLYTEMPLTQDTVLEVTNAQGTICNTLSVKNGQVSMVHATCPDNLCIQQGSISETHQTIVCLPNKVIVEIINTKGSGIDAVSE